MEGNKAGSKMKKAKSHEGRRKTASRGEKKHMTSAEGDGE